MWFLSGFCFGIVGSVGVKDDEIDLLMKVILCKRGKAKFFYFCRGWKFIV